MHTTLVYQYGLLSPIENAVVVEQHVRDSQALYNAMIRLENAARREMGASENVHCPTLAATRQIIEEQKEALGELRGRIKAMKGHRPNPEGLAAHKAALKALQAAATPLSESFKTLRERERADVEVLKKNEAYMRERAFIYDVVQKGYAKLYDDKTVHWGTYNITEASVEQAKTKRWGGMLRPRTVVGEGQIGVQIQGRAKVDEVMHADFSEGQLQIDPVPAQTYDKAVPKGERKRMSRTLLRMRIGTIDGTRKPIWGVWPLILHRPFPEGAEICGATINRHMEANRVRWTVQIAVRVLATPPVVPREKKVVALDLGWRKMESGCLRTFYWEDAEGEKGEWQLPTSVTDRLKLVDDLKSIRSKRQDQLQAALLALFSDREALDPELRLAVRSLSKWESPTRYVELLHLFEGVMPKVAVRLIREWHKGNRSTTEEDSEHRYNGDLHLWQYQTGVTSGALRHRKALHEQFALWLVSTYDVIVLERFKIPEVKDKPKPEHEDVDMPDDIVRMKKKASRQRDLAAPGYARQAIVNAAKRLGKIVIQVPAQNTTRICSNCGFSEKWEVEHELVHLCPQCGVASDQDANASTNILRLGLAVLSLEGAENLTAKPQTAAKWAKRHRGERGGDAPNEGGARNSVTPKDV